MTSYLPLKGECRSSLRLSVEWASALARYEGLGYPHFAKKNRSIVAVEEIDWGHPIRLQNGDCQIL